MALHWHWWSLYLAIWMLTAIGMHALSSIGEFLIYDLYRIRQIAKLKSTPKFPAIWYMYIGFSKPFTVDARHFRHRLVARFIAECHFVATCMCACSRGAHTANNHARYVARSRSSVHALYGNPVAWEYSRRLHLVSYYPLLFVYFFILPSLLTLVSCFLYLYMYMYIY